MNHAKELNNLIEISGRGYLSKSGNFRSFETESSASLADTLKAEKLFFSTSVLGMEAISHVIEDQAINYGGKFTFYAAFQKFSRLKPQQTRYNALCRTGNPINIFGIPDTRPVVSSSNLKQIDLPKPLSPYEPSLAHNWFVVLNNPSFVSMALVATELPKFNSGNSTLYSNSNKLIHRNFEGFWTYDQAVISEVVNILDNFIASEQPFKRQVAFS